MATRAKPYQAVCILEHDVRQQEASDGAEAGDDPVNHLAPKKVTHAQAEKKNFFHCHPFKKFDARGCRKHGRRPPPPPQQQQPTQSPQPGTAAAATVAAAVTAAATTRTTAGLE